MDQIEHVTERVVHRLRHQSKLAKECILGHCVGLGDDQVVPVWEELEGILEEVDRSTVNSCFHTEQSDREGVLGRLGRVRDRVQVSDLLADSLDRGVVRVLAMLLNLRQEVQHLGEWLVDSCKSTVFIIKLIKFSDAELCEQSVIGGHVVDRV